MAGEAMKIAGERARAVGGSLLSGSRRHMLESANWLIRLRNALLEQRQKSPVPSAPLDDAKSLCRALLSERGEASGAAVARELDECVRRLNQNEKLEFGRFISAEFGPDIAELRVAAEAYLFLMTADAAADLAKAAEPARQELLRRMNMAAGGTRTLVDLRSELIPHLKNDADLKLLDEDFRHLFTSWFNRGFLELRKISWQSPAAVLEKLIEYEAVHEIKGWDDLRRRLASDRRCFAFFHPSLPDDPLIFVEVALVDGLATSIGPVLLEVDEAEKKAAERQANTAIFYSISDCQKGLRGISFGNFLIKQVVEELRSELPQLTTFSTLSPIPGFRRWLEKAAQADERVDCVLRKLGGGRSVLEALPDTRTELLGLCARYLLGAEGGVTDPVARFHLGNGARLGKINYSADTSEKGVAEAFGLMVNYLYEPGSIEDNHEAFTREGVVSHSAEVAMLLRSGRSL